MAAPVCCMCVMNASVSAHALASAASEAVANSCADVQRVANCIGCIHTPLPYTTV